MLDASDFVSGFTPSAFPLGGRSATALTASPIPLSGAPWYFTSTANFWMRGCLCRPATTLRHRMGAVSNSCPQPPLPRSVRATWRERSSLGLLWEEEYDYTAGLVVLRLSGTLTPDEVAGYVAALAWLTGLTPSLAEAQ